MSSNHPPKALLRRVTDDFEQAFGTYFASDKDQHAFAELREAYRDWRGRRGDKGNGKHASRNAGCSLYGFLAYLARKPQNIGRDRSLGEMVAACSALFDDDGDAQAMYTRLQNAWRTKGASERRPSNANAEEAQPSLPAVLALGRPQDPSTSYRARETINGSAVEHAPSPLTTLASIRSPPAASPAHQQHRPGTDIASLPNPPQLAQEDHKQQIIAARKEAADLARHFCKVERDDVVRALHIEHQQELARVRDEVARATRAQVERELEAAYNARWRKLEREYDKAVAEAGGRKVKLEHDMTINKYAGQLEGTKTFEKSKRKVMEREKEPGREYKRRKAE